MDFWPIYQHYFGTVSPLSMGNCIWFFFLQKTWVFMSKTYNSQITPKYDIGHKEFVKEPSLFHLGWINLMVIWQRHSQTPTPKFLLRQHKPNFQVPLPSICFTQTQSNQAQHWCCSRQCVEFKSCYFLSLYFLVHRKQVGGSKQRTTFVKSEVLSSQNKLRTEFSMNFLFCTTTMRKHLNFHSTSLNMKREKIQPSI